MLKPCVIVINMKNTYVEKIREIAENTKYTKYYCNIVERALLRPQDRKHLKSVYGYVESHHILPKCFGLGGEKDKENLVFLTAKEHFVVHLCATKMFTSKFKNKMVFAFRQLKSSNPHQERYMNGRLYAQIKPNFKVFVRLYKGEKIKLIHESDKELVKEWEENGWSLEMTAEYKVGRVGHTKGMKHSTEARQNMSRAQKGKPKFALRGRKHSPEMIRKQQEGHKRFKNENPEEYKKLIENNRQRARKMHEDGIWNSKGENNPIFGKPRSTKTKQLIAEKAKIRWEKIKSDPALHEDYINTHRAASNKMWENQELRDRFKILKTKAFYKYNMQPQDFYDQKLKPLLYLGFLPTSIVKYKLLDMCAGSIKRLIYTFGNEEDKEQFEINKKKAAGANHAYKQFLEDQYNTHFKDKEG